MTLAILIGAMVYAMYRFGLLPEDQSQAQVAEVMDGDSLRLGTTRIRLFGIDAPEYTQLCQDAQNHNYPCGQKAMQTLKDLIGNSKVKCTAKDTDRYGRTVAVCKAQGIDLNAAMVRTGWAVAYTQYSLDYMPAEAEAHKAKRGLWSGSFEQPALYRYHEQHSKQQRETGAAGQD